MLSKHLAISLIPSSLSRIVCTVLWANLILQRILYQLFIHIFKSAYYV